MGKRTLAVAARLGGGWAVAVLLGLGALLQVGQASLAQKPASASSGASAPAIGSQGQLRRRTPEQESAAHSITLKVVVTDATGGLVGGLSAADFALSDNGREKLLSGFQAASGDSSHAPSRIVFLFDAMNESFENAAVDRKGLVEFLKQGSGPLMHPASLVVLSDEGVRVGKPSTDREVLLGDLKSVPGVIRQNNGAEGLNGWMRRYQASLRALDKLVAYESSLPGRVILIWLGPGWPMLQGGSFLESSERNKRSYFSTILDLTNRMREGGVTLDNLRPAALTWGGVGRADYYKAFLQPVRTAREADTANLALPVLALQSGGLVLTQTTAMASEINTCIAEADTYYTMTFEPEAGSHPDEYHSIEVKIRLSGLTARTNGGYYTQP